MGTSEEQRIAAVVLCTELALPVVPIGTACSANSVCMEPYVEYTLKYMELWLLDQTNHNKLHSIRKN
jgi:hypothetical protein